MSMGTEYACKVCGQIQPPESYYKSKSSKSGLDLRCKKCTRERLAKFAKANPAKVTAAHEKFRKSEKFRAWVERNRPRLVSQGLEASKRYREANPDKCSAAGRRYYRANAESEKARAMAWRENNPDEWKLIHRKSESARRAKIAGASARKILASDIERIKRSPCIHCGAVGDIHLDHAIPLSRGGSHSIGNIQPMCGPCNMSKKDKLYAEWRYRNKLEAA